MTSYDVTSNMFRSYRADVTVHSIPLRHLPDDAAVAMPDPDDDCDEAGRCRLTQG